MGHISQNTPTIDIPETIEEKFFQRSDANDILFNIALNEVIIEESMEMEDINPNDQFKFRW